MKIKARQAGSAHRLCLTSSVVWRLFPSCEILSFFRSRKHTGNTDFRSLCCRYAILLLLAGVCVCVLRLLVTLGMCGVRAMPFCKPFKSVSSSMNFNSDGRPQTVHSFK